MACLDVDLCGVCRLRVKANLILCVLCGRWIHSRCDSVKRVSPKFRKMLHAENVKGILERQWSSKKGYVLSENCKVIHISW